MNVSFCSFCEPVSAAFAINKVASWSAQWNEILGQRPRETQFRYACRFDPMWTCLGIFALVCPCSTSSFRPMRSRTCNFMEVRRSRTLPRTASWLSLTTCWTSSRQNHFCTVYPAHLARSHTMFHCFQAPGSLHTKLQFQASSAARVATPHNGPIVGSDGKDQPCGGCIANSLWFWKYHMILGSHADL